MRIRKRKTDDRRANRRANRRGVAVVEFAVCLPVLVVIVLGAIECCSMIFVDQSLNVVGYETARAVIRDNAVAGDGDTRAQQVITERKLRQTTVAFDPAIPEEVDRGTPITVTVSTPTGANSVMGLNFFSGSLEAVVVMNKE